MSKKFVLSCIFMLVLFNNYVCYDKLELANDSYHLRKENINLTNETTRNTVFINKNIESSIDYAKKKYDNISISDFNLTEDMKIFNNLNRYLQTVVISNFTTAYFIYVGIVIGLTTLNYIVLLVLCCRGYFESTDYCWVTMCYLFIPLFAWIVVIIVKRVCYPSPLNDQNCVVYNANNLVSNHLSNANNALYNNNQLIEISNRNMNMNNNFNNNNNYMNSNNQNNNYNNPYNNDIVRYTNNNQNNAINNNNNNNQYLRKESKIAEPGK